MPLVHFIMEKRMVCNILGPQKQLQLSNMLLRYYNRSVLLANTK